MATPVIIKDGQFDKAGGGRLGVLKGFFFKITRSIQTWKVFTRHKIYGENQEKCGNKLAVEGCLKNINLHVQSIPAKHKPSGEIEIGSSYQKLNNRR